MRTKQMKEINGKLYLGKFDIESLKEKYSTPLYVYDEEGIKEKIEIFKKYFVSKKFKCELVYASKAFIAPYLCDILEENDFSIDAVSMGDLYLIEKSGFPLSKVVLHGNNKDRYELTKAIDSDVEYIVVDNLKELKEIKDIAEKRKKVVKTLFRINPGIEAHTHAYIETSLLSSKFGESIYDDGLLKEIFMLYQTTDYVVLEGFHSHIGSQINNPESFVAEVKAMCSFINKVKETFGIEVKTLDLGGGFGIKYLEEDVAINLEDMLTKIVKTAEGILSNSLEKIMIEPGRSLVGDSGFTVYNCGRTKTTYGGKKYAFIDGGMPDNIRPALYQAKYSVDVANKIALEKSEKYDIAGKCCESGDIIACDVLLPPLKKNDTLVVYSTGAYCYSMSMNYNGLSRPAVIFVSKDEVNVAIRKESYAEQFSTCVFRKDKAEMKIFDTHSDMLYDLYTKDLKGDKDRFTSFHVPQLKQSIIKGGIWTMYSPDDFDLINACKVALSKIDLKAFDEFEVILGLEGLRNLKEAKDIYKLYDLGFRHAMLTWNEKNIYATGAKSDPESGLTNEGKKLLKIMEELDMIIDLAHLNEKSFFEVLEVTQKNIIYSHGCVKDLCDHKRNVTVEQMKALKEVDGLLGLTLAKTFISPKEEERDCEHFLDHLDYAVRYMGVDNVCFGFDFMDYLSDFSNDNIHDVSDATKASVIVEKMKNRGYSLEEINKITWDNFYKRYKDKVVLKQKK